LKKEACKLVRRKMSNELSDAERKEMDLLLERSIKPWKERRESQQGPPPGQPETEISLKNKQ
jgi:hypothetical protein